MMSRSDPNVRPDDVNSPAREKLGAADGQPLRGKQRKYLRGLGMSLEPVVFLGKAAMTDAVIAEVRAAIEARELVKVKLLESVDGDRHDVAAQLAAAVDSELIQVIGRNVLLYRRNEKKPRITLPA